MVNSKNNIVILLTGTINPNSFDVLAVKAPEVRRKQYIEAIFFYLINTDFKIIFIENSGVSLEHLFDEQDRIEFLTFSSPYSIPDKGKGAKEMEIIDYGMQNSKLICNAAGIIKITGRLKILNINKLAKHFKNQEIQNKKLVLCNVYKKFKMDSRCFFFTTDFWPTLKKHGKKVDLIYSLERALWDSICEYNLLCNRNYKQFNQPLRIEGVSGGFGTPYKHGNFLTIVKQIRHFFMIPFVYRKYGKSQIEP